MFMIGDIGGEKPKTYAESLERWKKYRAGELQQTDNNIKNNTMTQEEFCIELEKAIKNIFPESHVSCKMSGFSSDKSPYLAFTLGKDSSEYPNGYAENDNFKMSFWFWSKPGNKIVVEGNAQSFSVKAPAGSYLAFGRVKTKWRNFSTYTYEQAITKVVKFFEELKTQIIENKELLTEHSLQLAIKKGIVTQ